jgi:CDP-glucose 4,6-dehydratase
MNRLFKNVYQNKKVLITGNTGFKGSWLTTWLLELGAEVYGLSNEVPTHPSHYDAARLNDHIRYYEIDVRNAEAVNKVVQEVRPEFLFHLAAQPLVRLSYKEPETTLGTNIIGTLNVLEALRTVNCPCIAIMITSDKSYDNMEWTWGYRETDALGGKDPYSASKGAAEMVIKTYAHSYFSNPQSPIKTVVGRAGNVIGGGDWAEDRIVPDCMRSWSNDKSVEIRNPGATRPWQHVLEPLSGYLLLGQRLSQNPTLNAEAFNLGPNPNQNISVEKLIVEIKKHWPKALWNDTSDPEEIHEDNLLKLCCDKALHQLSWHAVLSFEETAQFTVEWYRWYYEHPNDVILEFTQKQISDYIAIAKTRELIWTS